eukprot:CAMPEP_0185026646 /NCGR_PEP_ID=MMETSP1103-20130426/10981_1 /TAXON_ID=36769 /ORGANISM="Paraphysomonas bandaiensis, Strain Caron Lab Isolate" /LENGTH=470 /DNA_ID=CAMNT_0027560297 /DNA_START=92 /DNA_END=1504 /DNA_ORIENTATION=+
MSSLKHRFAVALLLLKNIYKHNKQVASWRDDFERLMLSEFDIRRLYNIFRRVDMDGSGEIDVTEMLLYLDIENNVFSRQVFSIMDVDGSGQVDFREFVISVWSYATLGDEALYLFCFDLYDRDCSNVLELCEVGQMLRDVYGENFETSKRAMKLFNSITQSGTKRFGPSEFRDYAKSHPTLFFPAFEIQRKLQSKVLGKHFWKNHGKKRVARSGGREYVCINDLIGLRTVVADDVFPYHDGKQNESSSIAAMNAAAHDQKVKELMQLTDARGKRAQNIQRQTVPHAKQRRKSFDDKFARTLGGDKLERRRNEVDKYILQCSQPDKYKPMQSAADAIVSMPEAKTKKQSVSKSPTKPSKLLIPVVTQADTCELSLDGNLSTERSTEKGDSKRHRTPKSKRHSVLAKESSTVKSPTNNEFCSSRSKSRRACKSKCSIVPMLEVEGTVHPVLGKLADTNSPTKTSRPRRYSIG